MSHLVNESFDPSARPRVVHLADYGGTYAGSFVPMLRALGQATAARGWDVQFVLSEVARNQLWLEELRLTKAPIEFVSLPRTTGSAWLAQLLGEMSAPRTGLALCLNQLLGTSDRPTILHTHFSALDVPAAQYARRRKQTLVIWHEHSLRSQRPRNDLTGSFRYRWLGRNVERFLCVSPDIADSTRRFAPDHRVQLLPNAIEVSRFTPPTAASRRAARERLGVDQEVLVLLHFATPWYRKGTDRLLQMLRPLAARHSGPVVAFVVGWSEAQDLVDRAGAHPYARVMPPTPDVQQLYAAADVLVSPSRSEGMPYAVLEALASELSVVSSDLPGYTFIARHAPCCRTVVDGDPSGLADAVLELVGRDENLRDRETAATRLWIENEMSLDCWTRKVLSIYDAAFHGQEAC